MQTCVQHSIRENHGNIQHHLDIVFCIYQPLPMLDNRYRQEVDTSFLLPISEVFVTTAKQILKMFKFVS